MLRSSYQKCSVREGVLGNFAKFTGKYLPDLQLYLKRDSGTGVFL